MQAAALKLRDTPSLPRRTSEPSTRDELLILATNRFCDVDSNDRMFVNQFKEAFYLLVNECSRVTKQIVARTLSHYPATPRPVALYLAIETLEISTPILKHSLALGQLDLMRIVEMKGPDYAAVIASRPDLGPSLVSRLREFQEPAIQQALDENEALKIVGRKESVDAYFEEIDARSHGSTDAEPVEEQEPDTGLSKTENNLLAAAARGGRLTETSLVTPVQNEFDFGDFLEKMAVASSRQGMAVLMQKRFGLALETAYQVLDDASGDTLGVVLSAAEVEPAQANRILMLVFPTIGLSVHNAKRAIQFYAQLRSESSAEAVSKWPMAEAIDQPHQPYLEESKPVRRGEQHQVSSPPKQSEFEPIKATGS